MVRKRRRNKETIVRGRKAQEGKIVAENSIVISIPVLMVAMKILIVMWI